MCVYPLAYALEQVLSDTGLMDRWSSLSWQPMQVRMRGVSCPKVHKGGGVGVFIIQSANGQQRYRRSQEVRGMMEKKKRGGMREGGMNGEREGEKVVSCKTLEERPLLSPWICSWMKKAVKYVFHSSLILCHNKRIKEYCLRNLRCSRNGSLSSDDLRYCSVVFFYSPFNISDRKCEAGGGKRGCSVEGVEQ